MLFKVCKTCVFWLMLLSLAQFSLLCVALNELYNQLENGVVFKNMPSKKMVFQIGTFILVLFNFHVQLRKTCKCSHGYQSKRASLVLVFSSCFLSFTYFMIFLFQSIFFEPENTSNSTVTSKHALIGSASYFLLWLSFTIQYYRIYEFVDSLVKVNNDHGIPINEQAARDQYRVLEYERAYLENGSTIRRLFNDSPVEHAEYFYLQKTINELEKFKFAPKHMQHLDKIVSDMRSRAEKFSGLTESDKQRYTELATRFPNIVEPPKDPYYEYDRRVMNNSYCVNSKSNIWGGSRNTLI